MSYVICFLLVYKNPSRYPSDISDVTLKKFSSPMGLKIGLNTA